MRITKSFSEALEYLEKCSAIITIDSSLCWAASALDIPIIGLYSSNYLPGLISSDLIILLRKRHIILKDLMSQKFLLI